MTAKNDILTSIQNGISDSRDLSEKLHYNQAYVRRVVSQLAGEGLVQIIRRPRGHTYVAVEVTE